MCGLGLLTLRANHNTLVGYEKIPLALVPVMQGNVEAVRLLRENGVDYSKLRCVTKSSG
jgi:hypothetical protein